MKYDYGPPTRQREKYQFPLHVYNIIYYKLIIEKIKYGFTHALRIYVTSINDRLTSVYITCATLSRITMAV